MDPPLHRQRRIPGWLKVLGPSKRHHLRRCSRRQFHGPHHRRRGTSWTRQVLPPALPDEGAFAASNSSLAILGTQEAWFSTSGARVFYTRDAGKSWTVSQTPIRHDSKSAGIFSLLFIDPAHGLAVGGDYTKLTDDAHNIAITSDGGQTWTEPLSRPSGYRSSIICADQKCLATGPAGTDISNDAGLTWTPLSTPGFHALSHAGNAIFASGSAGRLEKLSPSPSRH